MHKSCRAVTGRKVGLTQAIEVMLTDDLADPVPIVLDMDVWFVGPENGKVVCERCRVHGIQRCVDEVDHANVDLVRCSDGRLFWVPRQDRPTSNQSQLYASEEDARQYGIPQMEEWLEMLREEVA